MIEAFEREFNLNLPQDYLELLSFSNGGHPELNVLGNGEWAVNRLFHLGEDRQSPDSLWKATATWSKTLGGKAIPFADDGGGNVFFLDLRAVPPSVAVCVHDEQFRIQPLAPSLGEFLGGLDSDPDMI